MPEFAAKTAAPGDDDATGGGGCSGYFCFINRAREAVGSTALVIPGTGWMSLPPKWYTISLLLPCIHHPVCGRPGNVDYGINTLWSV